MKFSLRLNNDHPVGTYVTLAQAAERAGFDQIWISNDLFLRSAPVILAAVAGATTRIEIGTCILNPYTINPAEIAMMAATLDELSQGRFNLGISSGAASFLDWVGISQARPRTAVIESIQVVRALLAGDKVEYEGHFLRWGAGAYLRFKPRRQVPIYIGAMSPKMVRAIGQYADGGLPLLFPPEHFQNVMPQIADGAKQEKRDISEIDAAACIWCSVSEDRDLALDVLKEKIAYYGRAMSQTILDQLGLAPDAFSEIEQLVTVENNLKKAKELVTPTMLRIGIAGNTADLIERLESLVAMGVAHISFGPPLGPDLLNAVECIGRDVIPEFGER
ncbi:MAG: LLM class flavin-dependent oxidoreductase [Chloroflexi bacterium]|nr:LLM class flavin-dependent oxidoreductase [Chloroflexota bacterium]